MWKGKDDRIDALPYSITFTETEKPFCSLKEGDWVEVSGVGQEYNGIKAYVMGLDEHNKKVLIRAFHRNRTDSSAILWMYPDFLKPSPLDDETKKELIDLALDLDDAVWFYELVGK